jgi:hypothetical protein
MPSPSPDPYVQLWFKELNQFQSSCISTDAEKLTPLLVFANSKILTYLKSTADQNNFLTAVGVKTGYKKLAIADLTTYPTFRGLLDHCDPLETDIFNVLQAASDPSVRTISSVLYYATPAAIAFPGKSTGQVWLGAKGILLASMDPSCYSPAQQIKVDAIVDQAAVTKTGLTTPASTMADVIKQIVVLG